MRQINFSYTIFLTCIVRYFGSNWVLNIYGWVNEPQIILSNCTTLNALLASDWNLSLSDFFFCLFKIVFQIWGVEVTQEISWSATFIYLLSKIFFLFKKDRVKLVWWQVCCCFFESLYRCINYPLLFLIPFVTQIWSIIILATP